MKNLGKPNRRAEVATGGNPNENDPGYDCSMKGAKEKLTTGSLRGRAEIGAGEAGSIKETPAITTINFVIRGEGDGRPQD